MKAKIERIGTVEIGDRRRKGEFAKDRSKKGVSCLGDQVIK